MSKAQVQQDIRYMLAATAASPTAASKIDPETIELLTLCLNDDRYISAIISVATFFFASEPRLISEDMTRTMHEIRVALILARLTGLPG